VRHGLDRLAQVCALVALGSARLAALLPLVALLLALVECQYELGNRVEIVVDDAYTTAEAEAFAAKVRAGAAMWKLDGCLEPFPMEGAEPSLIVTLYAPENFPHGPGLLGFTPTDDVVDVKGPTPGDELGLLSDVIGHEFGHVLRIPHNTDRTSIMYENSDGASVPNARDIAAARDRLGC